MIVLECENDKVVLQGPEWNDSHTVNMNVTFKKTMTGKVRTYIKKPTHTKSFTVSKHNRPAAQRLLDFMDKYYGKRITVTEIFEPDRIKDPEYKPDKWTGIIASPIESVHQAVRDNKTSIIFESVKNV